MKAFFIILILIAVGLFLPIPAFKQSTTCIESELNCATESSFVLGPSIYDLYVQSQTTVEPQP